MIFEESVVLEMDFDEALESVKSELAASGFGTLTQIDLQATLHDKVGTEMDRYVIVGACNPKLASAAIAADPLIGVLLPCNVVVREVAAGVQVDAMDPGLMASMTGDDRLGPIAEEARELISGALQRMMQR